MENITYGMTNASIFDYWAVIHFASGVGLGAFLALSFLVTRRDLFEKWRTYFSIGAGFIFLWEFFEMTLRMIENANPALADSMKEYVLPDFFEMESVLNVASDLVLGLIGLTLVYLGARFLLSEKSMRKTKKD